MNHLRLWGFVTTSAIHGAIVLAVVLLAGNHGVAANDGPKLAEMVTIEAALAYKAKTPQAVRQPQKPRSRARPVAPEIPVGVSRDETRAPKPTPEPSNTKPPKPTDDKPKPEEQPEDFASQFEKFRDLRQSGDNDDVFASEETFAGEPGGAASSDPGPSGGAFDGSEHGFAEINKGEPYMRELAGDANRFWVVPTLEQGSGSAAGCVQLHEDGRIVDTQLLESTSNATIDAAVKRALKKLTELRESGSKPVPDNLIQATREWICFKFPY